MEIQVTYAQMVVIKGGFSSTFVSVWAAVQDADNNYFTMRGFISGYPFSLVCQISALPTDASVIPAALNNDFPPSRNLRVSNI